MKFALVKMIHFKMFFICEMAYDIFERELIPNRIIIPYHIFKHLIRKIIEFFFLENYTGNDHQEILNGNGGHETTSNLKPVRTKIRKEIICK